MVDLTELFCLVDEFCVRLERALPALPSLLSSHGPAPRLAPGEVLTLFILFHMQRYREFKKFYTDHVLQHLTSEFPHLVSYPRYIAILPRYAFYFFAFLFHLLGACSGISFIDSTTLRVCLGKRVKSHKVFKGLAEWAKSSKGWVFGFKLHLVINDRGELLRVCLTRGRCDDRKVVPQLLQTLFGKVYGDKGYISQALFEKLFKEGVELVTKIKKNMKGALLPLVDKVMLRKRAVIESVIDQLKNISQIEHTRHRSPVNFCINVIAGLIAYSLQPKKPSLELQRDFPLAA